MAIAYLNHTPIGKSTQAQPYTARAHVWYITRPRHTHYTYSERMPLHRHAVMRFVTQREDAIRKNGRVCDKFIIALPREQSMEQNVDTLRDFGFRLSQGRAPFFFSIQDYGSDNPHAHFLFVDTDVETGERVAFTSEKGSTARIKELWEGTVNEHLLENGQEVQIAFGPKEQAIENDNAAPERPQMPLEPEPAEPVHQEAHEAFMLNYGTETLQGAIDSDENLEILRAERAELERLNRLVESAERDLEKAQALYEGVQKDYYAAKNEAQAADDLYNQYVKDDGSLKGFRLAIGKWTIYTSPTRTRAEEAQNLKARAEMLQREADTTLKEADHARGVAETIKREAEEKRQAVKHYLSTRGTPEELDVLEKELENTRDFYLEGVDLARVEEAYEKGELSESQYNRAVKLMGKTQEAELDAEAKALAAKWRDGEEVDIEDEDEL